MRTYKVNLPKGVKKTFGASKGVKVRLVNKNTGTSADYDGKKIKLNKVLLTLIQ